MSRAITYTLTGAAALLAGSLATAQAAPLPAASAASLAGTNSAVENVQYYYGGRRGYGRGFYGPRYGYGYRRGFYGPRYGYRRGVPAGAIAAGAALGIIGAATAASAYPYYGYGYGRLGGLNQPGQGNAIYDASGLPVWTPAIGVAVAGAPAPAPVAVPAAALLVDAGGAGAPAPEAWLA